MPTLRTYSVFICHDWEYSDEYYRVCDSLNDAPNSSWRTLGVPEHDPLDTDDMLQKNLRDQVHPADVVLVLAGMYTARNQWMDWEMAFAQRIGKHIIGVKPSRNVQSPRLCRTTRTKSLAGTPIRSSIQSGGTPHGGKK
jgi:hypothetical protein